jgi:hypothetical protein
MTIIITQIVLFLLHCIYEFTTLPLLFYIIIKLKISHKYKVQ